MLGFIPERNVSEAVLVAFSFSVLEGVVEHGLASLVGALSDVVGAGH